MDSNVTLEQYIADLNKVLDTGRQNGWLSPTPAGQIFMTVGRLERFLQKQKATAQAQDAAS